MLCINSEDWIWKWKTRFLLWTSTKEIYSTDICLQKYYLTWIFYFLQICILIYQFLWTRIEMDKREEKILIKLYSRIHLNSVYVAPLSRLLRSSVKRKTSYNHKIIIRLYHIFLKFFLSFFPRRNANRLHRTLSKHFINYKIIFR